MNRNKEKLLCEIELVEKFLEKKLSIELVDTIRRNFGFSYSTPINAKAYKNHLHQYEKWLEEQKLNELKNKQNEN